MCPNFWLVLYMKRQIPQSYTPNLSGNSVVYWPFLGLLLAAACLTVVFVFTAQGLCVTEVPGEHNTHRGDCVSKLDTGSSYGTERYQVTGQYYLRQCVIDVFCSTSTDRSRKSSSLLLTCPREGRRNTQMRWVSVLASSRAERHWCCSCSVTWPHTGTQDERAGLFNVLIVYVIEKHSACSVVKRVVQGHSLPPSLTLLFLSEHQCLLRRRYRRREWQSGRPMPQPVGAGGYPSELRAYYYRQS